MTGLGDPHLGGRGCLVWEVECYQLDLVGLASMHRVSVGIFTSPRLSAAMLEFDERVASLRLRAGGKL